MPQRILLIQSDVDDALAVRRSVLGLPDAGIEIEWLEDCAQGERRLGIAASETVAGVTGILTDLFLSDSEGVDTVDRLLRAAPGVPILLICSPQQEGIAKLAIQHGAHDYLLRGHFDDEMLAKSLRSMMQPAASIPALFKDKAHAQAMLNSIDDAVIGVDVRDEVTDLIVVAESLTVWSRQDAQQPSHLARHDSHTDLPNNTLFDDRLTQAMALAHRRGHKLSLIFLDMDDFKLINDSLGHLAGDGLLQSVAQRLLSCVRSTDTVSRRGGDEFIILLPEMVQADAGICAEKILATLREPHSIGQNLVNVTASIGIATYPDDGIAAGTLLRNADFAMCYAKSRGRSCYQFFKSVLNIPIRGRPAVEIERSQARHEFVVQY